MKLTRAIKVWLGIGTMWQACYMMLFFALVLFGLAMMEISGSSSAVDRIPEFVFIIVLAIHFLTILLVLGLTVFYIIYVMKDTRIDQTMKIVWIVSFFFAGVLVMPVFYFMHIWKDPVAMSVVPVPSH